MLVAALAALGGTLLGIAATASIIQRWVGERRAYLFAWSLTAVCLTAALSAQTVGFTITFAPILFRVVEVGAALLAVCGIAWGMVEYVAWQAPVMFGARLAVASFSIVAGVILAVDPLRRPPPSGQAPDAAQLYLPLPLLVLGVAHTVALLTVFGVLVLAALRTRNRDGHPVDRFICTLLAGVAALAVVAATRPGFAEFPAPGYPLLLGAGGGLVWWTVRRAVVPPARDTAPLAVATASDVGAGAPPDAASDGPSGAASGLGARAKAAGGRSRPARGGGVRPGDAGDAPPAKGPEPYGLIAIFTLVEGANGPFDRLTERTVQAVRDSEPHTLRFSCHTVANMPQQRIFYELYRDRRAYERHLRQPHVQRFHVERRPYVLATNVIELRLTATADFPEPDGN